MFYFIGLNETDGDVSVVCSADSIQELKTQLRTLEYPIEDGFAFEGRLISKNEVMQS